jgi:hypothetical protein
MRCQLLSREPLLFTSAVMDEPVLHRVVGGPAVMTARPERLIEVAHMPGGSASDSRANN